MRDFIRTDDIQDDKEDSKTQNFDGDDFDLRAELTKSFHTHPRDKLFNSAVLIPLWDKPIC
jgi:hypothetical protein